MLILFTAQALASILAVPMPASPVWLPRSADVPNLDAAGAFLELQLTVSPEGRVTQCTSPVSTAANEWGCAQAIENMRFDPATNVDGEPIFGRVEMGVRLKGKNGVWPPNPNGLTKWVLTSDQLPLRVRTSAMSTIALLVSGNGVVEQCLMKGLEPAMARDMAYRLEEDACRELRGNYKPVSVTDSTGRSVPYVQRIVFEFKRTSP